MNFVPKQASACLFLILMFFGCRLVIVVVFVGNIPKDAAYKSISANIFSWFHSFLKVLALAQVPESDAILFFSLFVWALWKKTVTADRKTLAQTLVRGQTKQNANQLPWKIWAALESGWEFLAKRQGEFQLSPAKISGTNCNQRNQENL